MPLIGATAGEPIWRPPEPFAVPSSVPEQSNIAFWFRGDYGCYKDSAGAEFCEPGDRVALWKNAGNRAQDGTQATAARRPIYRAGGAGGRPYLECDRAEQQYFADLSLLAFPSGLTGYGGWNAFAAAVEIEDASQISPVFGWADSASFRKGDFYFNTASQFRSWKSGFQFGSFTPGSTHTLATAQPGSGCTQRQAYDLVAAGSVSNCTNLASGAVTPGFLRKANYGGPGAFFHGKVYEIIVWNTGTTFSTTQLNAIMAYLNDKYDIT